MSKKKGKGGRHGHPDRGGGGGGDAAVVAHAAKKFGIPADILWGVYGQETTYGADVQDSSTGAQGPFQFMPGTAASYGVDVGSLKSSAKGAAQLLHDSGLKKDGSGLDQALGSYYGAVDQGYISGVLDKAKTFPGGGGTAPKSGKQGDFSSRLKLNKGTDPKFDEAGYQEALGQQLVANLIQKHKPDSPLLKLGLYSTAAPDKADFTTPGKPSKLVNKKGKPVPGAASEGTTAPGGRIKGGTYPLGEQGPIIGTPYQGTHTIGNWQSDNAVDIAVPEGTPVRAVTSGVIGPQIGSLGSGGRFAGLRVYVNGGGNSYYYAHLSKLAVKAGQKVKQGDIIGYSGSANGVAHLHFASQNGDPQDITSGGAKQKKRKKK